MNAPIENFIHAAQTDAAAIMNFAAAMAVKMHEAAMKGHAGWDDPEACTEDVLQMALREAIAKGDPVDVGNYAMMLFARGERTTMPQAFNVLYEQNEAMRDALHAVLDEVAAGSTATSVDSFLPKGLIDQVRRAASPEGL